MDKKIILLIPNTSQKSNKGPNCKTYPYWNELIDLLRPKYSLWQLLLNSEEKLLNVDKYVFVDRMIWEQIDFLEQCHTWISIDNYFQHLVHASKIKKPGIVLWGKTDYRIYGYPENINLFVDEKYFRKDAYGKFHDEEWIPEAFVKPEEILGKI